MRKRSILILLALAVLFALTACGGEKQTGEGQPKTPSDYLKAGVEALGSGDEDLMAQYMQNPNTLKDFGKSFNAQVDSDKIDTDELFKAMFDRAEVEVLDEKIEGDTATLKVKFKNASFVDAMAQAFEKLMQEMMDDLEGVQNGKYTEEKTQEKLVENLLTTFKEVPLTETDEKTVTMEKRGDGWMIREDEDFIHGVSVDGLGDEANAKLLEKIQQIQEDYTKKMTEKVGQ